MKAHERAGAIRGILVWKTVFNQTTPNDDMADQTGDERRERPRLQLKPRDESAAKQLEMERLHSGGKKVGDASDHRVFRGRTLGLALRRLGQLLRCFWGRSTYGFDFCREAARPHAHAACAPPIMHATAAADRWQYLHYRPAPAGLYLHTGPAPAYGTRAGAEYPLVWLPYLGPLLLLLCAHRTPLERPSPVRPCCQCAPANRSRRS